MTSARTASPARLAPVRASRVTLPVEHVLVAAACCRSAETHLAASYLAAPLRAAADALESALPAVVPQASAARALGVSEQALRRWVERGAVSLVREHPGALPGIPAPAVLALVSHVQRLRRRRRGRALARAVAMSRGPATPPRSASAAPPAAPRPPS